MGQKVNPTSLRVGINKYWQSTWFEKKDYSTILFVIEKLSIKLEIIHKRQNKDLQLVTDRIINSIKFIKK